MAVKLAPVPRQQYVDSSGNPYSGAKLFYYAAGTTTKQNTYTTSTGASANTNPIVLDPSGRTPFGVWLTEGVNYKAVLAPANDTDPPTSPIFTEDVFNGINDNSDATNQWAASGVTPTYVSATQFTVTGDKTSTFLVDRRVKCTVTAGTVYGYISVSAYTTLTTVTVVLDSGSLDSGLSAVQVGILTDLLSSIPLTITRNTATQTLTNKTLTAPTINGGTHTAITSFGIRSTGAAFDLTVANTEVLTAGRTLTIKLNDAARTIDIAGALTLAAAFTTSGANALTLTTTGATNVTLPTTGTLAVTTQATDTFGALTDVTTNNVSATAHGFCPKFPNNTTTFLRGDGTYAAPASALTLIATLTPTAAAAVNSLSSFSATYDNYLIIGEGITVAADDTLLIRLATGGALDTGSNYYEGASNAGDGTAGSSVEVQAVESTGVGMSFEMVVKNVNDATRAKGISIRSQAQSAAATWGDITRFGIYVATNTASGIGFYWSGGSNFGATGKIRIYGFANS